MMVMMTKIIDNDDDNEEDDDDSDDDDDDDELSFSLTFGLCSKRSFKELVDFLKTDDCNHENRQEPIKWSLYLSYSASERVRSVRTPWPRAKYFPVRLLYSVNRYI